MNVCFFSHSAEKGGAERSLLETIRVLKNRGDSCHVFLPRAGPLQCDLLAEGVRYTIWPYRWWADQRGTPRRRRILKCLTSCAALLLLPFLAYRVKQMGFDIIYSNSIVSPAGGIVALLLRLPHVWHIREFGIEDHDLFYYLGEELSCRFVDLASTVCLVNSKAVGQKHSRYVEPSKISVVYQAVSVPVSGMELEEYGPADNGALTCVTVGTLTPGKGQELAVRAVRSLRSVGKNVRLLIVGNGSYKYRKYLESLLEDDHLTNHDVQFSGYVDSPYRLMGNADVLLMCSRSEAFGRVTVEAMKLGLPVIGARSGGTTELISDGFNGYLFDPASVEDLADKLSKVYVDRPHLREMGMNARRWATESFSEEKYADEILLALTRAGARPGKVTI